MHGQADSTFGAVSLIRQSETPRHGASRYVLLALFILVALASCKSGAYLAAALCAVGALLSAPPVRERLGAGAGFGFNVMTVSLLGLLLVALDVLGAHAQGDAGVASVPIAAAQAESLSRVAVPAATAAPAKTAEPDFLALQQRKYGQLAGLPVQILSSTGGLTHDVQWSQRSSECIVALSSALIEQNDQDFRATLGSCVQQARQACAVLPHAGSATDVRSQFAVRNVSAQCAALRSQAASIGI